MQKQTRGDLVELDEAARRVGRRHAALIVSSVLAGLVLVLVIADGRTTAYESEALMSISADAPITFVQADASVDRVRALATSTSAVRTALSLARVEADVEELARDDVRVTALGSSGIVRLTVRRPTAPAAQRLADALAAEVVRRADLSPATARRARLSALLQEEAQLRARADALAPRGAAGAPAQASGSTTESLLVAVASERLRLQTLDAAAPRPAVLDRPAGPGEPVRQRLALDLGIGALIGLTAGLAMATAAETVRPGIRGISSIARALAVPALGVLPDRMRGNDLSLVARRLRLLASARGADTIVVLPLGRGAHLDGLVARLSSAVAEDLPTAPAVVRLPPPRHTSAGGLLVETWPQVQGASPRLRLCALADLQPEAAATAIAVLVAPSSVLKAELDEVLDVCASTGVALAGVVGRPRRLSKLVAEASS